MAERDEALREVRQLEYVWIPMRDGARLAARVWLPVDAEADPVPAILEAVPYRLSDGMATRDVLIHPYWAARGYACVRVDLRGSGESDGFLEDEYHPQEQEDLLEVIAWLAAQPWCSGGVGMTGISWGGFNSLQLAARRPPALKAIITLMSTDDRYADDVHYKGGCVLATDLLHWSTCMLHWQCQPPHEAAVGERWRELWERRLEANRPWIHTWLAHQRRDAYWRHGSVCEDYAAIEVPVYAIGGWTDGYTNSVLRLLEGLPGPRKGLIGPWPHAFPHYVTPGPAIGFLQEALRWWDHWLKGVDTGVMDEPMLRVWMQESVPPAPWMDEVPGRWVAEDAWPSPRLDPLTLRLDADGVLRGAGGRRGAGCRGGRRARRGRRPPQHPRRPALRRRRRRLVRREPAQRLRSRPAGGRGPVALLHLGAARRGPRDPRPPAPDAPLRERPAAGAGRRPAGRRGAGRRLQARHDAGLQPDAPDEPRGRGAPGARPGVRGDDRAGRDRPVLPGRPPPAPRALADLLAVGVALARARHAHRGRRREPAGAPGAAGAAGGRRPPALRPARGPRGSRREDASAAAPAAAPTPATSPPTTSPGPSATSTAATSSCPTAGRARSGTG